MQQKSYVLCLLAAWFKTKAGVKIWAVPQPTTKKFNTVFRVPLLLCINAMSQSAISQQLTISNFFAIFDMEEQSGFVCHFWMLWLRWMRFASLDQKFDLVSESHWFLYGFFILSRDIAHNICCHTFALDSNVRRAQVCGLTLKWSDNKIFTFLIQFSLPTGPVSSLYWLHDELLESVTN